MGNKMESSIFISVPIKGVFWHNKEKQPCLIASTVCSKFNGILSIGTEGLKMKLKAKQWRKQIQQPSLKIDLICLLTQKYNLLWEVMKNTFFNLKLLSPPQKTPHTHIFSLVLNETYGKNKTFLLQNYGIDFAPIKRYHKFCSQA